MSSMGVIDRISMRLGLVIDQNPGNQQIGGLAFGAVLLMGLGIWFATAGRNPGTKAISAMFFGGSLLYAWGAHRLWQNKRAYEARGTEMEQVAKEVV